MSAQIRSIPCVVIGEDADCTEYPTDVRVSAEHCPADPGSRIDPPAAECFEIEAINIYLPQAYIDTLTLDLCVRVQGGREVYGRVNLRDLMNGHRVRFRTSADHFDEDVSEWLKARD